MYFWGVFFLSVEKIAILLESLASRATDCSEGVVFVYVWYVYREGYPIKRVKCGCVSSVVQGMERVRMHV